MHLNERNKKFILTMQQINGEIIETKTIRSWMELNSQIHLNNTSKTAFTYL